jgi:uncharacterized membrane protein
MTDGEPLPAAPVRRPRLSDEDRARLVRSAAALIIAGASIVMMFQLLGPWLEGFVLSNMLAPRGRTIILIWTAVGGFCGALLAALLYWPRRRTTGLDRLELGARLLAPFVLCGLLPPLFSHGGWNDDLLFSLTAAAFVLALEPLVRIQLAAWPGVADLRLFRWLRDRWGRLSARLPAGLRRRLPFATVLIGAIGYAAYVATYTVRSHHHFNTYNYDLGQLDNQFYNLLHGHPFRCTPLIREGNWSELRNHAEFALFPLLPFYALSPRAETLLIMQAVIVASGAIPLYRFAARRLSPALGVVLAYAYMLYAPMHGAIFFDFHLQPLAAAFILWMVDFFDERRTALFVVFFILAISCREDISVGLASFGLFLMLTGHRTRAGFWICAVSTTVFVLLRFVFMPLAGSWGFAEIYKDLFPGEEHNFVGIVKTIVTNPVFTFKTMLTQDKLRYLIQVLVPVAFLPLRRIWLWLAVLPGIFFTVLTTGYGATTNIGYQYSGHFAAYIFPAAVLAMGAFGTSAEGLVRRRAAAVVIVLATLITTSRWGAIPPRTGFQSGYGTVNFKPISAEEKQRAVYLKELAARVPPQAKLGVSDRELPHVSNHLDVYTLMEGYEGSDYIIYVPFTGGRDGTQAGRAIAAGYKEVDHRPQLSLLQRPGAPPLLPEAKPAPKKP